MKKNRNYIFLGDYNTFGKLFIKTPIISKILQRLYGLNSKFDKELDDNLEIKKLIDENSLINHFELFKTCFYLPKTQIDYILTSQNIKVKNLGFQKFTRLSNHNEIFIIL